MCVRVHARVCVRVVAGPGGWADQGREGDRALGIEKHWTFNVVCQLCTQNVNGSAVVPSTASADLCW